MVILAVGVVVLGGSFLRIHINWGTKSIDFETSNSISLLTIIALTIITIPIVVYLKISQEATKSKKIDIVQDIYIPYFERIFTFLGNDKYMDWTYMLAVSNSNTISVEQYENSHDLNSYLKPRQFNQDFTKCNELLL